MGSNVRACAREERAMAGRPLAKINQTMSALLDATQGGREAEAKQLMARLSTLCAEAGIPRPALPEEVLELSNSWAMSIHDAPGLEAVPGTDLDLGTRHVLIDAGMKAARRLQALVDDDSAWGPGGWIEPRKQADVLGLVLLKAYGQLPSGARFLKLPDGSTGDKQRTREGDERLETETIGLMVRRRVQRNGHGVEEAEQVGDSPVSSVSVASDQGRGEVDVHQSPSRRRRRTTPEHG